MEETGLTLMEVTIVVAVVAMLIVAISPFIRTSYQAWDVGDRRMEVIQNARVGMDKMVSDLRQATAFNDVTDYDEDNGRIEFEILDENGVRHTRRFFFEDDWLKVWDRNEDTSVVEINDQVLAGPINTLNFRCYQEDGVTECNEPLPGVIEVDEIRSVEVALEVFDQEDRVEPITMTSRAFPRKKLVNLTLVINEIMYNPTNPQGGDAKAEWIELYNNTSSPIPVNNWQLSDGQQADTIVADLVHGGGTTIIPVPDGVTPGLGYAIITDGDTEIYEPGSPFLPLIRVATIKLRVDDNNIGNGLSNSSDTVTLLNGGGEVVDQVIYDESWGADGNDKTLERRFPPQGSSQSQTNWEEGPDNGTPGDQN